MTITPSRIAYIDAPSTTGGATTGPVGVALPIGTTLAAFVGSSGGGSTIGLSDSKGNTWTQRQYASNASSPSAVGAWFTTTLTVALTATDTLTGTSTAGTGCGDILLVKLTPTAGNTIAYHNGSVSPDGSTGTSPAVASFTPGTGNFVLVGLCESSTTLNSSANAPAGWGKIAGIDAHVRSRAVVAMYKTSAAAGAITAPWASVPAQFYAAAAISFVESAPPAADLVDEFARGSYNGTTTKTLASGNAIPITAAVPIGDLAVLVVDCPAGGGANTTFTVTDTKGNTWTQRALVVQTTTGGNGQVCILSSVITAALTTSDTITVTVNNFGAVGWAWIGLHFIGTTGFDVAATNAGATSKVLDSGTTAAGFQNLELVVAAFGYTGTGVTLTALPSGFISQPVQVATTTGPRNMAVVWGFVSVSGARNVGASMSDATNHAWCGAIAVYKSIAPPAPETTWFLWDGIAWVPAEALIPV